MNNIKWEDGKVCYAYGGQYTDPIITSVLRAKDFQLNEIRTGDYIKASELDTEQKYNDALAVFELFGFEFGDGAIRRLKGVSVYGNLTICHDGIYATELTKKWCKRQLTYNQIITIGKLKRMMLEREVGKVNKEFNESEIESVLSDADSHPFNLDEFSEVSTTKAFEDIKFSETLEEKPKRRNKSKQAYEILKSLDYDYDLVKQKWYKKQYIDQ